MEEVIIKTGKNKVIVKPVLSQFTLKLTLKTIEARKLIVLSFLANQHTKISL